ncbi:MAG: hypothetical protein C0483_17730 [Pirellula sp.]|nr:hypothetical protein [Pirellula sp.]
MRNTKKSSFKRLNVESLEDRLNLAGNVVVALSGGTLSVTGDAKDNSVTIEQISATVVRVTGNDTTDLAGNTVATTVKFGNSTAAFQDITVAAAIGLKVVMGAGNDTAALQDGSVKSLSVDMGAGSDNVIISNATVTGNSATNIKLGGSENQGDNFTATNFSAALSQVTINAGGGENGINLTTGSARSLEINGGSQDDYVNVSDVAVNGNVRINTGSGDDGAYFNGGSIAGSLFVDLGNGSDETSVNSNIVGTTDLKLGDGNDGSHFDGTTGKLSVNAGAGDDYFHSHGSFTVNATSGTTSIDMGSGNDDVSINGTSALVKNALTISMGKGVNSVQLLNTDVTGGALKISGGNDLDEVSLNTVNVSSTGAGSLSVDLGEYNGNLSLDTVNVAKDISVTSGKGNDGVTATGVTADKLTLKLGNGDNYINLDTVAKVAGTTALTSLIIETGSGRDILVLNSLLATTANVKVGDGDNTVNSTGSTFGKLTFVSGKGTDLVNLTTFEADTVDVKLGAGDDFVVAATSTFNTLVKINGEGGTDVLDALTNGNSGAALAAPVLTSITLI